MFEAIRLRCTEEGRRLRDLKDGVEHWIRGWHQYPTLGERTIEVGWPANRKCYVKVAELAEDRSSHTVKVYEGEHGQLLFTLSVKPDRTVNRIKWA